MKQITQEKLTELYRDYYKRLYASAEKIVKEHQRAQDVVQEIFLRLYKQDFSKIEDHIHKWLFTVCRNCSIKQYHKNNSYVLIENSEELDTIDESNSVSENMIKSVLSKSLVKLLNKLSKNQRKAIKLRYFQDLSYTTIAEKMKTTVGNVGFMLSTAIKKIKIELDKQNKKKGLY